MKIMITACNGQLGTDATAFFSENNEVAAFKDVELDITDRDKVFSEVKNIKPDVIINCAAITNVDGCESKPELAYSVNRDGAGIIAEACESVGARLVHISTDYVFDGRGKRPYLETDPVCPVNVYGKSKLEGEIKVAKACKKYYILRTAWLYGPAGNNFIKKIIKAAEGKEEIGVVTDETGNPTSTFELTRIINAVLKTENYGIYHATCEGECSRNAWAREIFRLANIDVKVKDITSGQYSRPASRPGFSVLSKEKLFKNCGYRPALWDAALKEYFDRNGGKA